MCGPKLLDGKTAVVTGGAQGIGKATAMELAEAGADIAVVDVAESVKDTAAEIQQAHGVKALGYVGDVTDMNACAELAAQIQKDFGGLHILVNNAGVTRDNLIMRMSEEEWDLVLKINLKGVFNWTKAVSRIMMKQRFGRIINVASVVGIMGNAGQANYSASKAGVIGLTKTTARELASRGITCNAVAPGFIKTAMTDKLSDEQRQLLEGQIPLQRLGLPEDVANVIVFLASPMADYVTGEVIRVSGGMAM